MILCAEDTVSVEIDGESFTFPADIDPLSFAYECEASADDEDDDALKAWGWKVAALLLASRVTAYPTERLTDERTV